MSVRRFPVTIEPAGVTVWTPEGTTVLDAARSAGVMIPAPCGGRGVCGKCAVKVIDGVAAQPDKEEQIGLKSAPAGVRMACRLKVTGPITIRPLVAAPSTASLGELDAEEPLVAGVDLGTTTVSAVIVGKESGRQLGRATVPNQQGSYGADVISRVAEAVSGRGDVLASAAQESVTDALCAACGRACACADEITRIVVAGNTVMASSLLGKDLSGLLAHPFVPPFDETTPLPVGWEGSRTLSEPFESLVLPPIAAFVGGDTSAALLAAGLVRTDQTCLLVDMGTNAEVAAVVGGQVTVTSAAAGPALEGVGLSCGGPYGEGAVARVAIEGSDVQLDVVGGGEPIWLAGSGLISAIAALRRSRHIDATGAMIADGELHDRFVEADGVKAIRLGAGPGGQDILLTQTDVRAFQQAKGGVAAAVYMLARAARVKPRKVQRLVVTGALGGSVSVTDLTELGVLPDDLASVAVSLEAAALTGAGMLASDTGLLDDVNAAVGRAIHVDLAAEEEFSAVYMAALALEPYTLKKGF